MKNFGVSFVIILILGMGSSYADPINSETSALQANRNAILEEILNEEQPTDGFLEDIYNNQDKRMERYGFGLGRRAYTYTNGAGNGNKRLPVYNFGLGKRGRPYSFGLGKRNDMEEYADFVDDKRNRPYSFGLGKRAPLRYDFGLGRR